MSDVCVYISPVNESDQGRDTLLAIADDLFAQDLLLKDPPEPFVVLAGTLDPDDLSNPYALGLRATGPDPLPENLRMPYRGTDPARLMAAARSVDPGDDLVVCLSCFNIHNPAIEKMLQDNRGGNADIHLVSFAKPAEITFIDGETEDPCSVTRRHLFFVAGEGAINSFDGSPVQTILDRHLGPAKNIDVSCC